MIMVSFRLRPTQRSYEERPVIYTKIQFLKKFGGVFGEEWPATTTLSQSTFYSPSVSLSLSLSHTEVYWPRRINTNLTDCLLL